MNRSIFTAIALALVAPVAAAQTAPRQDAPRPSAQQPPAGRTAAAVSPDRDFARRAAEAGAAEIAAGKLAIQKAQSDAVREFGQRMVADHQAGDSKLAEIAKAKNMPLPTTPDRAHEAELKKLDGLSGAAFDRAYMESQVRDHRHVIDMFDRQAKSGQDAELKRFANDTLPTLRAHLAMAQRAAGASSAANVDRPATRDQQTRSSAVSSGRQTQDAERARTQELNRREFERVQRGP